jgi:nascent polypeptide-associated complex subunit beta
MLPSIMQQLGAENMFNLNTLAKELASKAEELKGSAGATGAAGADDDDIPQLVENFDEASKKENI